jgi:hypothetical protein
MTDATAVQEKKTFRVVFETDEPTTDVTGFVVEMYKGVSAIYTDDPPGFMTLTLSDGSFYVYNMAHLRSYSLVQEDGQTTYTSTAYLEVL